VTTIPLGELMRPDEELKKLRAKHGRLPCPEPGCGKELVLRRSKHGLFWGCERYPACEASHGAHPDGSPLGVPADKETKAARIAAHAAFDRLWQAATKAGIKSARKGAYAWLQQVLHLSSEECHIGKFDKAMCERVIAVCEARLREETYT
jgi:ssDNA-binding Zn-finger/Zn-ribbon topoisomerase 1